MARVPQQAAQKGSQKWLQMVINQAPILLDRPIAEHLHLSPTGRTSWLSPLADDRYAEYRDADFLTRLGVDDARHSLREFWPERGPQWDGLGRTTRGECLLIEAKAHIPELLSAGTAALPRSRRVIEESLRRVKASLGSRATADWSDTFYQYTNRLAHLFFLRAVGKVPAFLVFVYFLNAEDVHGPRTVEEWAGAIRLLHAVLGIDESRLEKRFGNAILEVFIDVKDITAAAGVPG